jgi:hypothetical protein
MRLRFWCFRLWRSIPVQGARTRCAHLFGENIGSAIDIFASTLAKMG